MYLGIYVFEYQTRRICGLNIILQKVYFFELVKERVCNARENFGLMSADLERCTFRCSQGPFKIRRPSIFQYIIYGIYIYYGKKYTFIYFGMCACT